MERDGAGADSNTAAGLRAGDDGDATAITHARRDSVATSTYPDSGGAYAGGYSRRGASKGGGSPSVEARRSWARREHGAAPAIPPRYDGQAPSALVLLQSHQ